MKNSIVRLALISTTVLSPAAFAAGMEFTARGEGTAPTCAFVGVAPSDVPLDGTGTRIHINVSSKLTAGINISSAENVIADGEVTDVTPEWRVNGRVMNIPISNEEVYPPSFEIAAYADASQWENGTQLSARSVIELYCNAKS